MLPVILCLASNHDVTEQIVAGLLSEKIEGVLVFVEPHPEREIKPIPGLQQIQLKSKSSVGEGAITGGAVGALASVASMAIPFVGPFVFAATLPVTTAFGVAAGAAAGVAKSGLESHETASFPEGAPHDIQRLEDLGMPDTEIPRFQNALAQGRYLIAVRSAEENVLQKAETVFEATGGENITFFNTPSHL